MSVAGTLGFELGTGYVADADAKLGNWFASDFEKILQEVEILNQLLGHHFTF